jgi:hypothetical protein
MWMPTRTSPPVERLVGERVVEILGVVGVDGEDDLVAVIETAGELGREHAVGNLRGLALDVGGEFGGEIVL